MPVTRVEQTVTDRYLDGHLRYTIDGAVWATWRLQPLQRPRTPGAAEELHRAHAALWRAVVGHEFCLNAPLVWSDPEALVARMIDQVEVETHPEWAEECLWAAASFNDLGLATRRFYLSLRLNLPSRETARAWTWGACNRLAESAGIALLAPPDAVVRRARALAAALGKKLPKVFDPRPATEAELVWARVHAQTRSLEHSWDPEAVPEVGHELLSTASVSSPFLDPHGLTDLDEPTIGQRMNAPLKRRWLKVVTDSEEESYQSGMVLRRVPDEMQWPVSEFMGRIDDIGVPVDYAIRGTVRSRKKGMDENRAAMKRLNFQLDQVQDGDPNSASAMVRVQDGARVLAEYNTELARDEQEVEVEPIFLVSVAAPDGAAVDELARDFLTSPLWENFAWERPIGAQEDIFWAMQPGNHVTGKIKQFRQVALSRDAGATAPLQTSELGDGRGIPLAYDTSTGLRKLVLIDPFGAARDKNLNWGPSIVWIGDMGAGKTAGMKTTSGALMDHSHASLFATDNSRTREWYHFACSTPYEVAFVDLAAPASSLDPLRILPVEQAATVMKNFLTTLLDLDATEGEGLVLSKILKASYLREHGIDSAGALQQHLATCAIPGAEDLADRIGVFSDPDNAGSLARGIFDGALPPMDIWARAVIIGTCGLPLPKAEEIHNERLFRSLPPTKRFARAIYALIMDLGRTICAADPGRNNILCIDEFHHVSTSDEAISSVDKALREGRRDAVLLLAGTHDTVDIPPTLLALFRYRIAMRVNERTKAGRIAQDLLDVDPDKKPEEHAALEVDIAEGLKQGNGAAILRDGFQRVGDIQTLLPANPDRRAAVLSTPEESGPTSELENAATAEPAPSSADAADVETEAAPATSSASTSRARAAKRRTATKKASGGSATNRPAAAGAR